MERVRPKGKEGKTMKMTEMYFFDKMVTEHPERFWIGLAVAVAAIAFYIVTEIRKAK